MIAAYRFIYIDLSFTKRLSLSHSRNCNAASMDIAYIDFAMDAARNRIVIPDMRFIQTCIYNVSCSQFNVPEEALRLMVFAYMMPNERLYPSDILIKHKLIAFDNSYEAYLFLSGTVPPSDIALNANPAAPFFTLSLNGLRHCAEYYSDIETILMHASWILTSLNIYRRAR